jgi:hypothetical protein
MKAPAAASARASGPCGTPIATPPVRTDAALAHAFIAPKASSTTSSVRSTSASVCAVDT